MSYLVRLGNNARRIAEHGVTPISCAYTLDPLSGPLFGEANFPDADGIAQTFGFNTDDAQTPMTILHTNAVGSDGFRTLSGIRAFEIDFSGPATDPSTATTLFSNIGVAIHNAVGNAQLAVVSMKYTKANGVQLMYNAVNVIATFTTATAPSVIGIYMNAATNKVGITADGVDYGYQSGTPLTGVSEYYLRGVGDFIQTGYAGEQFDSGINSEGLTESFPADTLDMCGNTIDHVDRYVATFNGSSSEIAIPSVTYTGDFEISVDINPAVTGSALIILGEGATASNMIALLNTGVIRLRVGGNTHDSAVQSITVDTWYNVNIVRSGTTLTADLDGVEIINVTESATGIFDRVGVYGSGLNFNGKIKNVNLNGEHYYPIDDNSTTIEDHTGSNDGTATDLVWSLE